MSDAPGFSPPSPISTGRSLALGCAGFGAFFLFAAVAGGLVASTGAAGAAAVALVAAVAVVGLLRGNDARGRAVLARLAVGFAAGAVLFGGCLVLVANADFR